MLFFRGGMISFWQVSPEANHSPTEKLHFCTFFFLFCYKLEEEKKSAAPAAAGGMIVMEKLHFCPIWEHVVVSGTM